MSTHETVRTEGQKNRNVGTDARVLFGGLFGIAGLYLLTGAFRTNGTVFAPLLAKCSEGLCKIGCNLLEHK